MIEFTLDFIDINLMLNTVLVAIVFIAFLIKKSFENLKYRSVFNRLVFLLAHIAFIKIAHDVLVNSDEYIGAAAIIVTIGLLLSLVINDRKKVFLFLFLLLIPRWWYVDHIRPDFDLREKELQKTRVDCSGLLSAHCRQYDNDFVQSEMKLLQIDKNTLLVFSVLYVLMVVISNITIPQIIQSVNSKGRESIYIVKPEAVGTFDQITEWFFLNTEGFINLESVKLKIFLKTIHLFCMYSIPICLVIFFIADKGLINPSSLLIIPGAFVAASAHNGLLHWHQWRFCGDLYYQFCTADHSRIRRNLLYHLCIELTVHDMWANKSFRSVFNSVISEKIDIPDDYRIAELEIDSILEELQSSVA